MNRITDRTTLAVDSHIDPLMERIYALVGDPACNRVWMGVGWRIWGVDGDTRAVMHRHVERVMFRP